MSARLNTLVRQTLAASKDLKAVNTSAECVPESEAPWVDIPLFAGQAVQSKDLVPGEWCKSDRLRVLDFRLPPGESVIVRHTVPTVRWQVSEFDKEATKEPLFFERGTEHSIINESKEERREIVFEILKPPQLSEEDVKALMSKAEYSTSVAGNELKFENHLCRLSDMNCPPNGGDPTDFHQHVLPYGMVWIGETHMKVFEPDGNDKTQAKLLDDDMRINDGHFMWKQVERGGCDEDNRPHFAWAVHNVTNGSSEKWLRVLHIELK